MKKTYIILIVILVLVIGFLMIFRVGFTGGEDSWIKDDKGVYVKHGAPSGTPDYVLEQQNAITCATDLYKSSKAEGMEFNSQCLGSCGDFAVDVVHVPRTGEDDQVENQCSAYRNGSVHSFIELNSEGEIVRIA